jgi:hypothetical protein
MKQALRPDFILNSIPALEKTEKGEGPSKEEKDYFSMTFTEGWQNFIKLKDEVIEDMERANKSAVLQGLSFEQIGQNTVVINMVKDVLERLFNKVADATEVCEQNGTK